MDTDQPTVAGASATSHSHFTATDPTSSQHGTGVQEYKISAPTERSQWPATTEEALSKWTKATRISTTAPEIWVCRTVMFIFYFFII